MKGIIAGRFELNELNQVGLLKGRGTSSFFVWCFYDGFVIE